MAENGYNGYKFVIRGNYENTLRYLEKEKIQKPDVRFAFNTRKNSVEQNCQTPDHFFNEVLNLNHATSTLKRKKTLIAENRNRYSKDSGFSDWNSLERCKDNKVSIDRSQMNKPQEKIDISDLVLDQNIIELIDLGRFSHLTVQSNPTEDPLSVTHKNTVKSSTQCGAKTYRASQSTSTQSTSTNSALSQSTATQRTISQSPATQRTKTQNPATQRTTSQSTAAQRITPQSPAIQRITSQSTETQSITSQSSCISSQISTTSSSCGPDHVATEEIDYFDSNALNVERIRPDEATELHYRKFKNKHLQDVIRSSVKRRVSTDSHLSDLFDDLDHDFDDLCEAVAEKITEKLNMKTGETGAGRCSTTAPGTSGVSCDPLSHHVSSCGEMPARRVSDLQGGRVPPWDTTSYRASHHHHQEDGGGSCRCAVHGVNRYASVENSTQYTLDRASRKKSRKGKKLYRSSSAGDALDGVDKLDELVAAASKQKHSSIIGDFKRRVSMKPHGKKSKRMYRSNSAGDILDSDKIIGDVTKLKESRKSVPAILGDFKRRVSHKPERHENVPTPPPPPCCIVILAIVLDFIILYYSIFYHPLYIMVQYVL